MMKRKTVFRFFVSVLALVCCFSLASCGKKANAVLSLEYEGKTYSLSVNEVTLLMSRTKGMLASYGYAVDEDAFWDYPAGYGDDPEQTRGDYFFQTVLDNCKLYLAACALFDSYGLTLSESENETVEALMSELLQTDGGGSKTKLNGVLSAYGVNYDQLKNVYLIEAKTRILQSNLLSVATDDVKQEFLENNYVRYREISLVTFDYVYETDKNGDVVYRTEENLSSPVCYDKNNGVASESTDENGDTVYLVSGSDRIAYDSVNGFKNLLSASSGDGYRTTAKSDSEIAEIALQAETLASELAGCDEKTFEAAIESNSTEKLSADYADGYYLRKTVDYASYGNSYQYLAETVAKLDAMEVGEIAVIPSDNAYHVIRKYAPTQGAYSMSENTALLSDFETSLAEYLLDLYCRKLAPSVTVDETNLASVPAMKESAVNYYY